MMKILRAFSAAIALPLFLIVLLGAASADGADAGAEGPEDVPALALDADLSDNIDFLNCLCQCLEPVGGEILCRYNTTDPGNPPTDSCRDLTNGPCICEGMIGCTRGEPPMDGECYEHCRDLYSPDAEVDEPAVPSPASPGNLVPGASIGLIFETEPNNQIGDANEIQFASTASVEGRIAPANDVDFYKFYAETAGILTVEFKTLPPEMRARIGLFGKNFNWIVNKDASSPGDLVIFKKDVAGPGWNYIAISDLDGKAHSDDYTFEATFDPAPDMMEPNNEVGDGTYVETDQTLIGYICPQDDVDVYKFDASTSGVLRAKLTSVPAEMRPRIGLFGKNNNWIVNRDASNPGDAIALETGILGPGAYYVAVSDLDRKAHFEGYSMDLIFEEAPDEYEPNDQIGDAAFMKPNETAVGYICPSDDVDFFGFYVDHSGILKVRFNGVPDEMRPRIGLFGKSFSWILNSDASNAGDTISLEKDILGPGPYYIAISDLDRKTHSTEYSFDAIFEAAPDENEPNNQVGDATGAEFGKTIVGYICPQDDLDVYAFYVDASGILEVELADVPQDMKPRIALYGKNFNWIVNKDASNAGDEITLEKDVSEAGIYYVAISDIDRKAHSDSYTMMAILRAG
jgi:hypothetical protein